MLREIRELGFEYAELSHGIRISLLPGILAAVAAGEIKISSVHNFCPLPLGVNHAAPNVFKFTTSDRWERESALKHTLKTIETAARVGAGAIVLHMGRITMRDYTEKLLEMAGAGQLGSPRFEKLMSEAVEKRESRKDTYVDRADEARGGAGLNPAALQKPRHQAARRGAEHRRVLGILEPECCDPS